MKISWKRVTILDAIKNTYGSWEEVKASKSIGVWKKLIPNLMDDVEGLKASMEDVTPDVVEVGSILELELQSKEMTELL